jgi:hypothetical protein
VEGDQAAVGERARPGVRALAGGAQALGEQGLGAVGVHVVADGVEVEEQGRDPAGDLEERPLRAVPTRVGGSPVANASRG